MLKYRLLFGTLMVLFFVGLILADGWLDGSLTAADDKPVQGTIFVLLVMAVAFLAVPEMATLAANKHARVFPVPAIAGSVALATMWYWMQMSTAPAAFGLGYLLIAASVSLAAVFLWQAVFFGTDGVIVNCSVNYLTIFYLGFLSSFILAIRVVFGPWALLMFIFTVKFADTGAYTAGKLFGKHQFSPRISPGKTWEGLAGAVVAGVITAVCMSVICGIMPWFYGTLFGVLFAVLGQFGDLAESMLKRDAEQKDSSSNIPGFGGVLDIVDSLLGTAPAAYLFFVLA
ncbi:MAG TPA: phosphatidate cytidylyltransferase [Anaerohalosphaeraceae bacterium]|jgi:phosphatidate cytidylyltransferase|nr:phosphatidate cytidylyltransferase [Anaerohalosphaeraceae bacterium]HRT51001.1 phosphatidate cytidylyltransferase [Anaerohalosphaeraceae bacterium]HRT86987.1 phosphatidate cytidylyltransferase [Anaerohalosphaeraceae bacterium]